MSLNLYQKQKQKTWASAAGIVAIVALCVYVLCTALSASVKAAIVIAGAYFSWKLAKVLYDYLIRAALQPIRLLKKSLPACGFVIERTEWNEEKTLLRFYGKFRGQDFIIDAFTFSLYVFFYDLPWKSIESSDPNAERMVEAIHDTNASKANMSVIMLPPNENGLLRIYTLARSILPLYRTHEYLKLLMTDMLICRPQLQDNFCKDRPWLKQARRDPVGFHVAPTPDEKEPEKTPAPAATENTPIN